MSNLQPLKWKKGAALDTFETVHELVHYTIRPDIDDPNKYRANLGNGDHKTLNSVDEAKHWIETDYYPHKMRPYVKPSPTWIGVDDRLPDSECFYLVRLFDGHRDDYVFVVLWWNIEHQQFLEWDAMCEPTHWMPIPEFSTTQNLHNTSEANND